MKEKYIEWGNVTFWDFCLWTRHRIIKRTVFRTFYHLLNVLSKNNSKISLYSLFSKVSVHLQRLREYFIIYIAITDYCNHRYAICIIIHISEMTRYALCSDKNTRIAQCQIYYLQFCIETCGPSSLFL